MAGWLNICPKSTTRALFLFSGSSDDASMCSPSKRHLRRLRACEWAQSNESHLVVREVAALGNDDEIGAASRDFLDSLRIAGAIVRIKLRHEAVRQITLREVRLVRLFPKRVHQPGQSSTGNSRAGRGPS